MKALPNWKTRWARFCRRHGSTRARPLPGELPDRGGSGDLRVQTGCGGADFGTGSQIRERGNPQGRKEAVHSNRALAEILRQTADDFEEMPINALSLVESRDEVSQLVQMSEELDLIIPRGSNELVQSIQARAQVPVLGHADGICHVFIDANADPEKAGRWFWIPKQIIPRSVMPWKPCWWTVSLAPNF